jgi:hypothetical protein
MTSLTIGHTLYRQSIVDICLVIVTDVQSSIVFCTFYMFVYEIARRTDAIGDRHVCTVFAFVISRNNDSESIGGDTPLPVTRRTYVRSLWIHIEKTVVSCRPIGKIERSPMATTPPTLERCFVRARPLYLASARHENGKERRKTSSVVLHLLSSSWIDRVRTTRYRQSLHDVNRFIWSNV